MTGSQIWFIAKSNFKERTRSFSFLALCALSVLAAFLFVPDPNAVITSIAVDADCFLQGTNWTWIPMASALCSGVLLPVIGFFYLRNSLALDRKTGTVNLIYTSPLNRITYLAGKYLSNIFIMLFLLFIVVLSSLCMTIFHFPGVEISIFHYVSFFISIIPGIFLCSAVALIAEATPVFQSRSGLWLVGIIFFVLYIICLDSLLKLPQGVIARFFDMTGFAWLKEGIDQSVYSITGNRAKVALGVYKDSALSNLSRPELFFLPLSFTAEKIFEKSCMIVFGMAVCVVASAIMPRYEKHRETTMISEKTYRKSRGHGLLMTEFILSFRSCSVAWFFIMSVLWLSMFVADIDTAQGILWVLTMAWSCILFSDYGCREKKCDLDTLLPTLGSTYALQLLIRWCVGGMISLIISIPVILRTILIGAFSGTVAGIAFALFIPALSIFLGQISGSERTFEIIFLVMCYFMLNSTSFIELAATSEKAFIYDVIIVALSSLLLVFSLGKRMLRVHKIYR